MNVSLQLFERVYEWCQAELEGLSPNPARVQMATEDVLKCLAFTVANDDEARDLFAKMVNDARVNTGRG
jgi:hypothetical protein